MDSGIGLYNFKSKTAISLFQSYIDMETESGWQGTFLFALH